LLGVWHQLPVKILNHDFHKINKIIKIV
jgi:hypothetical protein